MNDYREDMLKIALDNATPEELTLMLYDGALRFTNEALENLDNNKFSSACELMARAGDIIQELQVTLNHEYSIARPMHDLYKYMYRRLAQATVAESESREIVLEVRELLRDFRTTWKKAMERAEAVV